MGLRLLSIRQTSEVEMSNPWKFLKRNLIFQNKFGYKLFEDDVTTPSGSEGKYMVLESLGFVTIIALTRDKKILMERQWRYPVGKEFLELPAGTIDEEENPLESAKRELLEETGSTSDNWVKLSSYWLGNGAMKIRGHVFLAQDIFVGQDSQEAVEKISVEYLDFDEAVKMVVDGKIDEDRTITGLLLAEKYLNK